MILPLYNTTYGCSKGNEIILLRRILPLVAKIGYVLIDNKAWMINQLSDLFDRQQRKVKAFDPLSVDYIDVVDDWIVDRCAMFSGPAEQPNWMEINQSVNRITSREPTEDEFESFIEGTSICISFCRLYLWGNDKS
jgi:hypothetical protein